MKIRPMDDCCRAAGTLAATAMLVPLTGAAEIVSDRSSAEIPTYQILDLGTLGGHQSIALDLNEAGHVIGDSTIATGEFRAFLYSDGQMIDLTLGGLTSSGAAINDAGQVTGESANAEGDTHAFLYTDGEMLDLGTVDGTYSSGNDVNAAGQVTGISTAPNGEYHAFLYTDGVMQDLDTLGDYSNGAAINDAGEVTGIYDSDFETHAFLYTEGSMVDLVPSSSSFIEPSLQTINSAGDVTGSYRADSVRTGFVSQGGDTIDLGTLGGEHSAGFAINDAAEITGSSTTANGESHAFLYSQGTMTDLGTLGGTYSIGYAINNAGQVTGQSSTSTGEHHPFVYRDGEMVHLDVGALGGIGGVGHAINDAGQVAGWYDVLGVFEQESRAFLATPISLLFSRLVEEVQGLGPGASLGKKLETAEGRYAAADLPGSCTALRSFVQEAKAQSGKRSLDEESAGGLIADAGSIQDALHCR